MDGTIRFTHPLLASVLYQGLSADERRRVHRRLARLAEDPVTRARHLALSTDEPDAELAAALEQAAEAAAVQGAPIAAGELGEHAVRLTPPEQPRGRRSSRGRGGARASRRGRGRASPSAGHRAPRASPGGRRARRGALAHGRGRGGGAGAQRSSCCARRCREPGAPLALQASIQQRLSLIVRFSEGLAAAERHARAAVELAEQLGDDALRAAAMAGLALIRFNAGKPGALRLAEEAYALASGAAALQPVADAGFALGAHSRLVGRARPSTHSAREPLPGLE